MHNHVNAVVRQSEKKVRLYHLERLVRKRRTVHRDLATHLPGWMLQCVRKRGALDALVRPGAKRATGCGKYEPTNLGSRPAPNALQDCRMLRIHRNQLAATFSRCRQHEVAANHQRFLVCESHALSMVQRRERGIEPGSPNHRVQNDVRTWQCCSLDEALSAALPIAIRTVTNHSHELRTESFRLLAQQRLVAEGSERRNGKTIALPVEYAKRSGSNGAGGAEKCDTLRLRSGAGAGHRIGGTIRNSIRK